MKHIRKIVVTFLALFIVLITTSQSAVAKEWEFQAINDVNKVFKVRFNIPLDSGSLTANSIYVLDGQNKYATTLRMAGNGYTVEVSPTVPYEVGKQYWLMITKAVNAADGKGLKTQIEVPFQVVNPDTKIQAIHSKSSGLFTTITVMTTPDVHRVTVAGEDMRYEGSNRYMSTLLDVKPGSKVSIISYDENNKRLETKSHTLEASGF